MSTTDAPLNCAEHDLPLQPSGSGHDLSLRCPTGPTVVGLRFCRRCGTDGGNALVSKVSWISGMCSPCYATDKTPAKGCPDGGTCHHLCESRCFRVEACGPLSGVFLGDVWPDKMVAQHNELTKPSATMPTWVDAKLRIEYTPCDCGGWDRHYLITQWVTDDGIVQDIIRTLGQQHHMRGCPERPSTDIGVQGLAADSERDQRLGDEAVADLTAMIGSESADSLNMPIGMAVALRNKVDRLTVLLAQQVETIEQERVAFRESHEAQVERIRGQIATIEQLTADAQQTDWKAVGRALGSQGTEE